MVWNDVWIVVDLVSENLKLLSIVKILTTAVCYLCDRLMICRKYLFSQIVG
jgi:hypothetical protein